MRSKYGSSSSSSEITTMSYCADLVAALVDGLFVPLVEGLFCEANVTLPIGSCLSSFPTDTVSRVSRLETLDDLARFRW